MSDVDRERETLARAIHDATCACDWDEASQDDLDDAFDQASAVLAALPGLGWVRQPVVDEWAVDRAYGAEEEERRNGVYGRALVRFMERAGVKVLPEPEETH